MEVKRPSNATPARPDWIQTLAWVAAITVFTVIYFLAYFYPMSLFDPSHYAVSGVSMVRDHKNLLYPYLDIPPGAGPIYENFQSGTVQFDTRTDYPSKLYSLIFGLIWSSTGGEFRLQYLQWIDFSMLLTSFLLLYLVGREYLPGPKNAVLLLSVALLPITRNIMVPGSDSSGVMVVLLLTWLVVRFRLNPLLLGLIAGVACHLRGQSLSVIVVIPFIYVAATDRSLLRGALLPFGVGCIAAYLAVANLFNIMLGESLGSSGATFYIDHFSKSFILDQPLVVLAKFATIFVALFEVKQVYFLTPLVLVLLLIVKDRFVRNITIAAAVYSLLPMIVYSFDRFALPGPRYYMAAMPLAMLGLMVFIERLRDASLLRSSVLPYLTILAMSFVGWSATHGFSMRLLDIGNHLERAAYLDFEGAQGAMTATFTRDSIVLINNTLPTGLAPIEKVVYAPPFERFIQGDNKAVDGIAFAYGDDIPDNYFSPAGWLQDGRLPDEIVDLAGTRFEKIYDGLSSMVEPMSGGTSTSHFVIFKRVEPGSDNSNAE